MTLNQLTSSLSYPPAVPSFISEKRKYKLPPELMVESARRQYGPDYASAVACALASPSRAIASAHIEAKKLLRQRLKELGYKPVRIPDRKLRLTKAIESLLDHLSEGRKPSASRSVQQPGLDERQAKKLAYQIPVKKDLILEVLTRHSDSPIVHRMLKDPGLKDMVINNHSSLSKLASALNNANRSLVQRVADLQAAVMQLTGEVPSQREGGNARGHWHPQALRLRKEGKTVNQIARLLGRSTGAVKQVLSRHAEGQSRP